ncbi:MAG TPA: Yip1 family protein [Longimicrobiales bacterium]
MDTTEATNPPVETKSRWEDYLDVFFSPGELFRRRANDRLGPPLITLLVLATAFYYILLPAQKMILRAQMELAMPEGGLPPGAEKMMNLMPIFGGIMQPIIYLIMTALTAFLLWALCRAVGAKPTFRQMMIVSTYTMFIFLLGQIAGWVAVMLHGPAGLEPLKHMTFGVTRFMDTKNTSKALVGLLGIFSIFAIWQAVLWAIAVHVVTGVSKGKAAMVAIGTWLLTGLPGIIGGLMSGGAAGPGGVQVQVE